MTTIVFNPQSAIRNPQLFGRRTRDNRKSNVERGLLEVFDALWDDFVDPRDAFADGRRVVAAGGGRLARRPASASGSFNEQSLGELRGPVPAAGGDE